MKAQEYYPGMEAAERLKAVIEGAFTPEEVAAAAEKLNESIFKSGNIKEVQALFLETIQPLLKGERPEPVLMFHAYGWQYGGAERVIASISSYLASKGYRIILTAFEPIRTTSYWLDPSITFVPIYGSEAGVERLLLLSCLLRPDVFLGHNSSIPDFAAIYPQLRKSQIRSIAYTLEYYFFPHRHPALFPSVVTRAEALGQATVACFLNRFGANAHGARFGNAALMPVSSSFHVVPETPGKRMSKTVLAVGRFNDPIKRLDRVLVAFKHVLVRHEDAKLLVVGPYDLTARIPAHSSVTIEELLVKLCIPQDRIRFVGEQGQTEPFYRKADVFVLTSDSEGFPLVLTEAGSCGLASVVVDIPGLEDVITNGANGYIVPQDDMQQMADKISRLLDDPDLLDNMGRNAREMIMRFSIERIGARWDELIQLVLSSTSQEDTNRELAERFMQPVEDQDSFIRHIVSEYEQTGVKIANIPVERPYSRLDRLEVLIGQIIHYWRANGFNETAGKMVRASVAVIQERYGSISFRIRKRN